MKGDHVWTEWFLLALLLVTMLGFLVPLFFAQRPILLGSESYFHLTKIRSGIENGFLPISHYTPYHLLVAHLAVFLGFEKSALIVSSIFTLASLLLFALLVHHASSHHRFRLFSLLLFSSSPLFFLMSLSATPHSMSLFFDLLLLWCALGMDGWQRHLIWPSAFFASVFGIINSTIVIVVLCVLPLYTRIKSFFSIILSILLLSALHFYVPPTLTRLQEHTLGSTIFIELGSSAGVTLFACILALIGISIIRRKYKMEATITGVLGVIGILFLKDFSTTLYILSPAIAYFGARGLSYFVERKWEIPALCFLTILIFFCGILFSGIVFFKQLHRERVDPDLLSALSWLRAHKEGNEIVLTAPRYGFWVEWFGEVDAFADAASPQHVALTKEIAYTRNLVHAKNFFSEHNITHLLIDQEMKERTLWISPDHGLLFLLRNKETFEKIYDAGGVELWEIHARG